MAARKRLSAVERAFTSNGTYASGWHRCCSTRRTRRQRKRNASQWWQRRSRLPRAQRKARTQHTADGKPVHSSRTLLQDLATIAKDRIQPKVEGVEPFDMLTRPTALQS